MVTNDQVKRRDQKQEENARAKRLRDDYDEELACEVWFEEEAEIKACEGLEETRLNLVEDIGEKEVMRIESLVGDWISEVKAAGYEEDDEGLAFDDVSGMTMPASKVKAARLEEVGFMMSKPLWEVVPTTQCWARTGKAPVSVK